uniref:Uncharacterized protein n=1 Tax=Ralstonia syzygii R24 TaxID=907261 RepID=G3ABS1_9RALS|nr:hypothetical protein RALSY_mp30290 [Ralstonia syzygii R24]
MRRFPKRFLEGLGNKIAFFGETLGENRVKRPL